ncbi:hypothetical protein RDABS01_002570 [Bienertia sinuspersici]
MVANLEERWKALSLTKAEDDALVCEEEEVDEVSDQLVALSLVGKLLTNAPFNPEALKNTMRSLWKPTKSLVVREIEDNIFVFQFFLWADREKVLEQGPWLFDGKLLLLKEVKKGEQPAEMAFNIVRFWVKAYQIPVDRRRRSMAVAIANKMGKFVDFDGTDPFGYKKFRSEATKEAELKLLEDFKSSSVHHIDGIIEGLFSDERWRLTGFYGDSDHIPLKLMEYKGSSGSRRKGASFRFENFWLTSDECADVIDDVWHATSVTAPGLFPERLNKVGRALKEWSKREKGWDEEKVRRIFLDFEAEQILAMPLSEHPSSDALVWHYDSDGEYSAKSGYKFIRWFNCVRDRPSSSSCTTEVWGKTWSLVLPPKVKVFLWRACARALPTKCGLAVRGIGDDVVCHVCGAEKEDIIHALVHCPAARVVWEASDVVLDFEELTYASDFLAWWEAALNNLKVDDCCKVAMICYGLWSARNESIFKEKPRCHGDIIGAALSFYAAFCEVNSATALQGEGMI